MQTNGKTNKCFVVKFNTNVYLRKTKNHHTFVSGKKFIKTGMKERLIELMQLLNCTPTQFANAIGVQRATLQHILNGRNEPSLKIIMAVHDSFPQVDLEWLLYGRGNTFGETSPQKQDNNDYPLFPGMESTVFPAHSKENSDFLNLKEEKGPLNTRKKTNNKGVSTDANNTLNNTQKRIKEVVIFFEDGTYQKISTELKK